MEKVIKTYKKIYLYLSVAYLFFATCALGAQKTGILFILYDAGETLALQPTLEALEAKKADFRALVMGTSRSILHNCTYCLDIQKDCGTEALIDQKDWEREHPLSIADLDKVKKCIESPIVVSGVVSEAQRQLDQAFKKSGSWVIAYHDAFSPVESDSLNRRFLPEVDEYWVPSELIAKPLRKTAPNRKIVVVGQPTLEKWSIAAKKENSGEIKKQIDGFKSGKKTILYAGQYGEGYEQALNLFFQAASRMPEYQYLLALHPKVDGTLEKKVLEKFPQLKILFVPKSTGTMKAALVSDLIISQNSTVGIQALFMNKAVYYLDQQASSYTNFAIQNGWAHQSSTSEQFTQSVRKILDTPKTKGAIDFYSRSGVPRNSTNRIVEILVKKHKSKKPIKRI